MSDGGGLVNFSLNWNPSFPSAVKKYPDLFNQVAHGVTACKVG